MSSAPSLPADGTASVAAAGVAAASSLTAGHSAATGAPDGLSEKPGAVPVFTRVVESFAYKVLAFCGWAERAALPCVNLAAARATVQNPYHYRWLCEQLQWHHLLHVPTILPALVTHRELFRELWTYRHVFLPAAAGDTVGAASQPGLGGEASAVSAGGDRGGGAAAAGTFANAANDDSAAAAPDNQKPQLRRDPCEIAVAVRFRPALARGSQSRPDLKRTKVVLPLYQRLQLIRAQNAQSEGKGGKGGKLSIAESLQVLKESGEWFGERFAAEEAAEAAAAAVSGGGGGGGGDASLSGGADKTEVSKTADQGFARVESIDTASGEVVMVAPSVGLRRFNFQSVLPPSASQTYVYDAAPRQLIADFLNGFNASIVVYGQTGSGKTFTMFGKETSHFKDMESSAYIRSKFREHNRQRGMVIRACEEVFEAVAHRRQAAAKQGWMYEAELSVTYVEIFGDAILDLLDAGNAVAHTKAAAAKFVLAGENSVAVRSLNEVLAALEVGERSKRTAATAMNERSSRAHTLFIMTLKQTTQMPRRPTAAAAGASVTDEPLNVNTVTSQLFLADLGGSEQVKKSLVATGRVDEHIGHVLGEQMREAVYINQGLFALKKCIRGLNKQDDYIPYQDSKLTRLLAGGLGGDSKSMVIICASMDEFDSAETLQALRFGEQCQRVKNDATVGQQQVTGLIQKLDTRIAELEAAIRDKEHWEDIKIKRQDENLEEGTFEAALAEKAGGEVVHTTRLVGAETERAELVKLLHRRAALAGKTLELGQMYGIKPDALSGNAVHRYAEQSAKGLIMKGKKVAEWTV